MQALVSITEKKIYLKIVMILYAHICTYLHCIIAIYYSCGSVQIMVNKKETATSETRATMSMIY